MKKMRGRFAGPVISNRVTKSGYDPSHVAYTELKITSDSDNEFPFSDDDDHNSVADEMEPKEGLKIQDVYELPTRSRASSVATKNLTNMSSNARVPHDGKHLECGSYSRQDLVGGNQQQGNVKTHPIPKLISLDDFYLSFNMMEASVGVSTEKSEVKFAVGQNSDSSALSEFISLLDVPSSFTVVGGPFEASHKKSADSTGSSIIRQTPINKHEGNVKSIITIGGTSTKSNQVSKELLPTNAPSVDLSGGLKSSTVNKERDVFDCVAENTNKKDAGDTEEELKPFPRENSATQGTDIYLSCPLSGKQGNVNELHIINASNSNGVVTKKSISTEIGESSGFESLDVNEVEGENIVDQLKHQVEYDKECISALSLELEEERNASAIAANQAMAMINRLQEEKAALHMEALQYLRMMEEQAEYDVDALEKANDLVAEKEKEIQDLEAELEYFRLKYPGESALEVTFEEIMELRQKVNTKGNANITCSSMFSERPSSVGTSMPCFEEERKYIAHCLEGLERKLHKFARDRALPDSSGSDDSSETRDGEHDVGASTNEEPSEMDDQVNDQPASSLTLPAHEKRDKDHKINQHKKKLLDQYDEVDWMSLRSELSDLNERVESLETDHNFLEHTLNSLEAGKEGVQFVQEISRQLLELRKKISD
ncbi:hypothetical protein K2173_018391 [Erythroxylum novogranatense]|uniref:GTD-binding domain-containing protein n=1 Tax=Erythroxylum novogranatense TaxID=1862640 RepID=A0AAV8UDM7_9ROSI|nr:hypothetical protein K2173_018391 [Erythroxylum novogranatense]